MIGTLMSYFSLSSTRQQPERWYNMWYCCNLIGHLHKVQTITSKNSQHQIIWENLSTPGVECGGLESKLFFRNSICGIADKVRTNWPSCGRFIYTSLMHVWGITVPVQCDVLGLHVVLLHPAATAGLPPQHLQPLLGLKHQPSHNVSNMVIC